MLAAALSLLISTDTQQVTWLIAANKWGSQVSSAIKKVLTIALHKA